MRVHAPAAVREERDESEKALDRILDMLIIANMPTGKPTMSELLRQALRDADSLRSVANATGLDVGSLSRFAKGEQSLRLDLADRLAAHFGIESRRATRGRKGR